MIYSVWRPEFSCYDYYEAAPKASDADVPAPRIRASRLIGVSPAEAAWRLPAGSHKVGSGPVARGMIATGDADLFGVPLWLLAVGGLALYWWTRNH